MGRAPNPSEPLADGGASGRIDGQSEAVLHAGNSRMTVATSYRQPFPLTPQTASRVDVPGEVTSPFQRLGFNVLLVFLFLAFSRIFDVKFGGLHITGDCLPYRIRHGAAEPGVPGRAENQCREGSAWIYDLLRPVCAVQHVEDRQQGRFSEHVAGVLLRRVSGRGGPGPQLSTVVQGYSKRLRTRFLVFTIIANVFGISDNGRLFLAQGKFANPNEMAQALLLGLPLWGVMMVVSKSLPGKVFAVWVMVLILATTFRTGSRGAMIGFVAMLLVVFLRAPIMGKMQIILAGVLFLGIVLTTMPGRLISRYKTHRR